MSRFINATPHDAIPLFISFFFFNIVYWRVQYNCGSSI